jgi:hypothetical protein
MLLLTAQYLLAGLIVSFILEIFIRQSNQTVLFWERISMIVFWPIMMAVFVWHFIKGFLGD